MSLRLFPVLFFFILCGLIYECILLHFYGFLKSHKDQDYFFEHICTGPSGSSQQVDKLHHNMWLVYQNCINVWFPTLFTLSLTSCMRMRMYLQRHYKSSREMHEWGKVQTRWYEAKREQKKRRRRTHMLPFSLSHRHVFRMHKASHR